MQFKYPEILYALFALIIPIIVHLFQLRRFKKQTFTNVAVLKRVKLQTRKSAQLKKWLLLATRLLLFAAIILAFAQPYTSKTNVLNKPIETVVYLDNSFSMQAKGKQGELFKRAVQDLVSQIPENQNLSLFTNNRTFKNTTVSAIKNDLLNLDYTNTPLSYDAAYLKGKNLFNQAGHLKNFIFISDFQQKKNHFTPKKETAINFSAVSLKPENVTNVSIDSIYVSNKTATVLELTVNVNSNTAQTENMPISLYDGEKLLAKTSASLAPDGTAVFSIDRNLPINGRVSITDNGLQFDNDLFFNINPSKKINVLAITNGQADFIARIFTKDEFELTTVAENALNYSTIEDQNLIVLNELDQIPSALANALLTFMQHGGSVVIIPSNTLSKDSYNSFVSAFGVRFNDLSPTPKHLTQINFDHPLFENVFNNRVHNFQYPKIERHFNLELESYANILQLEDQSPFLAQVKNLYVFSGAINKDNSNFQHSPLIVPTLYNIGKQSLKMPQLYYSLGQQVSFDVPVSLQQDAVLTMALDNNNMIPQQQAYSNKVTLTTANYLNQAGIYSLYNKDELVQHVSYNYDRDESKLHYQDLSNFNDIEVYNSIPHVFNVIKSETNINVLWKWFVIFALVFVLIEMLILKYFK
ncbi:membrane protein [Mangrovimonas yunxiaonensis]|uniref:Membrane protein n=1 Tax=Mangrovimonas yunxiaonensis TaxID=1197477 RepID=A0A084THX3_9FLAO|nr:BatA domain-containing protein [Mangrovimonas yunxiaonensis]KFB00309.1 membrane protein [Mangrovimonas yunxiaonensis]GGH41628.1 membrane protein [Mangrovimonas yunxiaonensis]